MPLFRFDVRYSMLTDSLPIRSVHFRKTFSAQLPPLRPIARQLNARTSISSPIFLGRDKNTDQPKISESILQLHHRDEMALVLEPRDFGRSSRRPVALSWFVRAMTSVTRSTSRSVACRTAIRCPRSSRNSSYDRPSCPEPHALFLRALPVLTYSSSGDANGRLEFDRGEVFDDFSCVVRCGCPRTVLRRPLARTWQSSKNAMFGSPRFSVSAISRTR